MTAVPVLTRAELSRATAHRQLLGRARELDPIEAHARLLAVQAQEPASVYLSMWTRLSDFRAADLDAALESRQLVKATLFRSTLHTVTVEDYHLLRSAMHVVREPEPVAEALLACAAVPRPNTELAAVVAEHAGGADPARLWSDLRRWLPLVHVPGHQGPARWAYGAQPGLVDAGRWLPPPSRAWTREDALAELVRRYLLAFGPASIRDLARMGGLAMAPLRAAVGRLGSELIDYTDENGTALLDLASAELPPAGLELPVRFLPMWDSTLLGYDYPNRRRTVSAEHRARVIRSNGDTLATFTVDGLVAGLWRTVPAAEGCAIDWHPFTRLPRRVRAEVDVEAARLAAWLTPRDPEVYRRYARWWDAATAV